MSFLDDLKKQAGNLQAQQDDGQRTIMRNTQLVEAAARTLRDFRFDARRKLLRDIEVIDRVLIAGIVRGQARLDELARWWVGEPNRFLDDALNLRRVEAR